MAYRFNGSSDYVQFALGPFNGATFGPATIAFFFKRTGLGNFDALVALTNSGLSERVMLYLSSSDVLYVYKGTSPSNGGLSPASMTPWYLAAATFPGGSSTTGRLHLHDGASWSHAAGSATLGADLTIVGTDLLVVGRTSNATFWLGADVVCAGIKKADSTDLQVETLSRTAFSAWTAFGFDWLVSFDASSTRTNVANPGSGDETARSGTSVVSDPPGWISASGGGGTGSSGVNPATFIIR